MTVDDVRRIKQRHESELLAIEGVEGVGVAEDHGAPAIKLYIDPSTLRRTLPKTLEHIPVVVEESGQFEAQ